MASTEATVLPAVLVCLCYRLCLVKDRDKCLNVSLQVWGVFGICVQSSGSSLVVRRV